MFISFHCTWDVLVTLIFSNMNVSTKCVNILERCIQILAQTNELTVHIFYNCQNMHFCF